MGELRKLLEERIESDFENFEKIGIDSEEYPTVVSNLTKLYNLALEEEKIRMAHDEKIEEHKLNEKKLEYAHSEKLEELKNSRDRANMEHTDRINDRDMNHIDKVDDRKLDEKRLNTAHQEKLEELKLNREKANTEHLDRVEAMHLDDNHKNALLNESKTERYVKIGIAAAELVVPLVFYGVWMKRGFKFEESGTFTSSTFRGLFNRFKPTK